MFKKINLYPLCIKIKFTYTNNAFILLEIKMLTIMVIMSEDEKQSRFLAIIKSYVSFKLKGSPHISFKDDIAQEVFIKLFKANTFDNYNLENKESSLKAAGYIKKAVHSCYSDFLQKAGVFRRLSKVEQESSGKKTMTIIHDDIDEYYSDSDSKTSQSLSFTAEQYLIAKEAYNQIFNCFSKVMDTVNNSVKSHFLNEAFWSLDEYGLPLNKLASFLGYEHTNPTQDYNRFVEKVDICTSRHGININNSSEQIELLKQIIDDGGAEK